MSDISALSPATIRELVDTLRSLDREHRHGFAIDAINMRHVSKALARVDAELGVRPPTVSIAAEELPRAAVSAHFGAMQNEHS